MVISALKLKLISTALTMAMRRIAAHGVPQFLCVRPRNFGSSLSRDIWNCGLAPVAR